MRITVAQQAAFVKCGELGALGAWGALEVFVSKPAINSFCPYLDSITSLSFGLILTHVHQLSGSPCLLSRRYVSMGKAT